ncbi:MAG: hypothetical protein HY584_05545 [Candidatus Omnitrophica bacterium]|nr:hypothetical protein [Candidatus Omnitrophota bacterium]
MLKFQSVLKVPAVQLVHQPGTSKVISNHPYQILIASATRWLPQLP